MSPPPPGAAGAGGQFRFADGAGAARVLPPKTGNQVLTAAEKVIIDTPGAGGYGPPSARAPEARDADRRSGKFSDAFMAQHYSESTGDD